MSPKSNSVIEWDGLWMDEDGIYYLLECKHFMNSVLSWCHFANHVGDPDAPQNVEILRNTTSASKTPGSVGTSDQDKASG